MAGKLVSEDEQLFTEHSVPEITLTTKSSKIHTRRRLYFYGFWLQVVINIVIVGWCTHAQVQMMSYNQVVSTITRDVSILRRQLLYLDHMKKRTPQRKLQHVVNRWLHTLDEVAVFDKEFDDPPESIPPRRRRSGGHKSSMDKEFIPTPSNIDMPATSTIKPDRNKKGGCPNLNIGTIREAHDVCSRSKDLTHRMRRSLQHLSGLIKPLISQQTEHAHVEPHPTIHLVPKVFREPRVHQLMKWDPTNPLSHNTEADGTVSGVNTAYQLDQFEMVNITMRGRYMVYAQVTFQGRNVSRNRLNTLDCGFRIVIARSIHHLNDRIGLFYAQTTQYNLGESDMIGSPYDSAYVSGVMNLEPGDELAVDMDRGVPLRDACDFLYDGSKTFFGVIKLG